MFYIMTNGETLIKYERGLLLLQQRGYAEVTNDSRRFTKEFALDLREALQLYAQEITYDTIQDSIRHTILTKGPATDEELDSMVYAAYSSLESIAGRVGRNAID